MINLLPYSVKSQMKAARMNVLLLRYSLLIFLASAFLAVACVVVYMIMENTRQAAQQTIIDNTSQNPDSASSIENEATALRTNTANAKSIMNRDLRYSNVITGIAGVLPSGVIVENILLNSETFGSPINLQLRAKNNDAALNIRDNFERSPLFSSFNLRSLSQSGSDDYPVIVNISVTINRSAAL